MKWVTFIILSIFLVFLSIEIGSFWRRGARLDKERAELQAELLGAQALREKLKAEYEFFLRPENVEKELRARFNLRLRDERLIILVPPQATGTVGEAP